MLVFEGSESDGLFHFLAEPYEKKPVVITSSPWDQIFKDPMTTMAAVDRLVHHATILEFTENPIQGGRRRKAPASEIRLALSFCCDSLGELIRRGG